MEIVCLALNSNRYDVIVILMLSNRLTRIVEPALNQGVWDGFHSYKGSSHEGHIESILGATKSVSSAQMNLNT